MSGLGMKKWRPFNSVIPVRELLNSDNNIPLPELSGSEIEEIEEILKFSLYTHSDITVYYIIDNKIVTLKDHVIGLDPIKKNIVFPSKKINFRQVIKVEK